MAHGTSASVRQGEMPYEYKGGMIYGYSYYME